MTRKLVTELPKDTIALEAARLVQADSLSRRGKYVRTPAVGDGAEVHEYKGPRGMGFLVYESVVKDGQEYRRVSGDGPEGERAHGWLSYTPDVTSQ